MVSAIEGDVVCGQGVRDDEEVVQSMSGTGDDELSTKPSVNKNMQWLEYRVNGVKHDYAPSG